MSDPLELPFSELSLEVLQAIGERHGLHVTHFERMPQVGIINAIYALGNDYVLRVPKNHPGCIATARRESLAVPVARQAGIRTPALVAFDDSCTILDVPYTIYERVHGETLGLLGLEPCETASAYWSLGQELARLHAGISPSSRTEALTRSPLPDPRPLPDALAEAGYFTSLEARWLGDWLEHLAPAALAPAPARFLHADTQATNVMVSAATRDYLALLDWGEAGWGEMAYDFAHLPLRAVPLVLRGYQTLAPIDEAIEARILWCHLSHALRTLQRPPQPGRAWAERPLGFLLGLVRLMMETPDPRWRACLPETRLPLLEAAAH